MIPSQNGGKWKNNIEMGVTAALCNDVDWVQCNLDNHIASGNSDGTLNYLQCF